MDILCVIPARGKSKRIPGKNLRRVCAKPLIAYAIESALESKLCNRKVVSTDDVNIAKAAERFGIQVVMRPARFATDTSPIDDALRHAVRYFGEKDSCYPEIVVLLQANVPIRKSGEIDEVVRKLIRTKGATAVVTAYQVDQMPEWMKVIDRKTGRVRPFMKLTNLYRKQSLRPLYLFDGAIMAVRTKVLMEKEGVDLIHAYLGENVYALIHDKKYAIEVDEPGDFEMAEYFLKESR